MKWLKRLFGNTADTDEPNVPTAPGTVPIAPSSASPPAALPAPASVEDSRTGTTNAAVPRPEAPPSVGATAARYLDHSGREDKTIPIELVSISPPGDHYEVDLLEPYADPCTRKITAFRMWFGSSVDVSTWKQGTLHCPKRNKSGDVTVVEVRLAGVDSAGWGPTAYLAPDCLPADLLDEFVGLTGYKTHDGLNSSPRVYFRPTKSGASTAPEPERGSVGPGDQFKDLKVRCNASCKREWSLDQCSHVKVREREILFTCPGCGRSCWHDRP